MAELSDFSAMPPAPETAATPTAAVSGQHAQPRAQVDEQPPVPWARVALALIELAMAGASLLLMFRQFSMNEGQLDAFLASNVLDAASRLQMLLQVFVAAVVPSVLGVAVLLRFQASGVRWLIRAGELCSPASVAFMLPTLLNYRQWYAHPLPYLALLLGFVLCLEGLLTRAFGAGALADQPAGWFARRSSRIRHRVPLIAVVACATAYSLYMSYYTILRHKMQGTAGFDLGIFDNLMMNALHGHPFRSTVAVPYGSYLSNHAEYGMFLFVPLYAIKPGAETLLVLQSTFMGFATVPLYFFAATQVSRASAAAIACASLLYAPLHGANFYDFHWMPMSMFFFYWMFYALATRRLWWIAILTVVICSMREDTAFGLIAAGLYLIVSGYWPRLGGVLTGVSAAWFVLVKFVIMPWAGPWWFADIYKDLIASGEQGYGSVVRTILINPNYFLKLLINEVKTTYILHLMAPLALLPLRHPTLAVLMLPGFFVTLMTTGYAPTVSIAFQYTTTWAPFLFAATAIALRLRSLRLGPAGRRASVIAVCAGIACHSYVFGAILQHHSFIGGFSPVYFDISPGEEKRYQDLRAVAALIPPDASVAAGELEIAHVSARVDAYTLKVTSGDADYFFLSREHFDSEARQRVRKSMMKYPYGLVARKGEFFLFKKGHKSADTKSALSALSLHGVLTDP